MPKKPVRTTVIDSVGADDVVHPGPLGAVPAVVAVAAGHRAEGPGPRAERGQPRVVLVADHGPEVLALERDVPDEPARPGHRLGVDEADARDLVAGAREEAVPEELVEAADGQHGHAVGRPGHQLRPARREVVLDALLPGVLPGLKSLIILLVILAMSALSLISLSIKDATNRASEETFGNITNSFSMEINRQVNPGTPRGGGNVKGQDIKKISESKDIDYFVKRINSVADLVGHDIIETQETISNQSPERAKNFKRTVMLTGVNDSSKETKFVSGAYKLVKGDHLDNQDKNKILMHKDLAKKNNLKVGDKIKIKSNLFDADNEKGANETVEAEIKGLFDGHNNGGVSAAQELYENTLITDINTAAKVYGKTEDTAVYQDATFFVKGNKNLDQIIKDLKKLDINWRGYNLIKSSSNYPALQQSISGIYSIANKLFAGSLIFAGVVVSLLLFLWMNARKKEIAVLLSLGISKVRIFRQFVMELLFVSIPAFIGAYFLADYTGRKLGNIILNKVTGDIGKQIARQSSSSQLGGGAEVDSFNKTLTSLDVNILPESVVYVVLFMTLVLIISLIISSLSILKKNPKELLIDTK